MIALELPTEIENRLEAQAKRTGRTMADCVMEAVGDYLDDAEDLEIAEQRLLEIESGKVQAVPLAEVRRRYGMGN